MSRKKRRRRRLWLVLAMALVIVLALLVKFRYAPIVREAARTRVVNLASDRINDAINGQIESGAVDYGGLVALEKDAQGRITALRTNMAQVNQLKAQTMALLSRELAEMETESLTIPLGSILMPELFAGSGPGIPIRVISLSTTDSEFFSEFTSAGINQTQQRILLRVTICLNLLTPVGKEVVDVSSELVVAQTVIVGTVPESFVQLTPDP